MKNAIKFEKSVINYEEKTNAEIETLKTQFSALQERFHGVRAFWAKLYDGKTSKEDLIGMEELISEDKNRIQTQMNVVSRAIEEAEVSQDKMVSSTATLIRDFSKGRSSTQAESFNSMSEAEITRSAMEVYKFIAKNPSCIRREIAEGLNKSDGGVSGRISELIKQGHIVTDGTRWDEKRNRNVTAYRVNTQL